MTDQLTTKIEVFAFLREAFARVKGTKAPMWGGFGLYIAISFAVGFVLGALWGGIFGAWQMFYGPASPLSVKISMIILRIIVFIPIFPMLVGLLLMGVKWIDKRAIKTTDIFKPYRQYWRLLGTFILILAIILVTLGGAWCLAYVSELTANTNTVLSLLAIVGTLGLFCLYIYFMLAYAFALVLVLEKNLSPWQALETSRKAVTKQWWRLFGLGIMKVIILVLACIPVGIGLIWAVPMGFNVYGLCYQRLFGTAT